ncbi:MAG: hypothetical protein JO304_16745 [Solirubrobacterales bacterium]|nr:hypothetical protein [Solirubrobacterales bacterium]
MSRRVGRWLVAGCAGAAVALSAAPAETITYSQQTARDGAPPDDHLTGQRR